MLVGCDGAEDNLCEALSGKHPKTDASNYTAIFDQGEGFVLPVKKEEITSAIVRTGGWDCVPSALETSTYGSNTSRVMYSFGMRGN